MGLVAAVVIALGFGHSIQAHGLEIAIIFALIPCVQQDWLKATHLLLDNQLAQAVSASELVEQEGNWIVCDGAREFG